MSSTFAPAFASIRVGRFAPSVQVRRDAAGGRWDQHGPDHYSRTDRQRGVPKLSARDDAAEIDLKNKCSAFHPRTRSRSSPLLQIDHGSLRTRQRGHRLLPGPPAPNAIGRVFAHALVIRASRHRQQRRIPEGGGRISLSLCGVFCARARVCVFGDRAARMLLFFCAGLSNHWHVQHWGIYANDRRNRPQESCTDPNTGHFHANVRANPAR